MLCFLDSKSKFAIYCKSLSHVDQFGLQAYPFVVRKVLRNASSGSALLLRDLMYDSNGNVKPTRLSALLNAALGYVADQTDGFVDFDAVPAEGASAQVSTVLHITFPVTYNS